MAEAQQSSENESRALAEARQYCREVTRDRARNFYYGLRLLPQEKREALFTLYAWMRCADDLVDDEIDDVDRAAARLEALRQRTDAVFSGDDEQVAAGENGELELPLLWIAMRDLIRRYPVEQRLFHDMIDGQRRDLQCREYATWDELVQYCHLVASSVGLLCIAIWGYNDDRAPAMAVENGVAFQLTNILRDFREDYDNDRVYLPAEVFDAHGLTAAQLYQWSNEARCRALVLDVAARAEQSYERSGQLVDLISRDCRPTLVAMREIYHGLLRRIVQRPQCVANDRRIRLSGLAKLSIAGRALWSRRSADGGRQGAAL